ncbi:MAG: UDP binding domain-containing protein, partial [Candidatus Zixiibacteriota bacterium]
LKGSKILVLGVAYKRDIKDLRESPALDVMELLQIAGAEVEYSDPHVPSIGMDDSEMKSVRLTKKTLQGSDCVAILTDHSAYDYDFIVRNAQLVMDTRNATKNVQKNREKIVKL